MRRRSRKVAGSNGATFVAGIRAIVENSCIRNFRSHLFRHDVRRAIGAAEQRVGFVVADDLFCRGVEFQGAAEAVGGVGQVHQRGGDVGFFDGGVDVLGAAAADAVDEIGVVVAGGFAVGAGLDFVGEPGLVGVVAIYGEVTVGAVEEVADRVGLGVFGAEGRLNVGRLFFCGLFGGGGAQACRRHAAASVSAGADFGFVVGDPVADFELHHFAFAVLCFDDEGGVQGVRSFLVVFEHEVAADGGDCRGKPYAQAGASDVDLVDSLVADFAVAGVPDPMPVVVKAIFGEGF